MSKTNCDDKAFVLEKVQKYSYALIYASDRLKDDEEVVLATAKSDGITALRFASDRLKDNEEVVLAAVNQNASSLEYASARLKDNETIVLASVKKNGRYLQYASDRLRDNEEVILAAVNHYGPVLRYASERLRSDVPFCISIAKKKPESIAYFSGEAKDLFQAHNNNPEAIELFYAQEQQNKANEALLSKLSTGEIVVSTNKLFKRKLFNV